MLLIVDHMGMGHSPPQMQGVGHFNVMNSLGHQDNTGKRVLGLRAQIIWDMDSMDLGPRDSMAQGPRDSLAQGPRDSMA